MGDKVGKKNKEKVQKQMINKQEHKAQQKQDKQHKSTPWKESGFEGAKASISDKV